jgi:hypothetical protein
MEAQSPRFTARNAEVSAATLAVQPGPDARTFPGQTLERIDMRNTHWSKWLVAVGLIAVSIPLFAHHGNASYDGEEVTIKGTVTTWLWTNPHTFLKVDVKDEKGNTIHWICENNAPSTLVNFGFTAKTFKPGDEVTVVMSATSKTLPIGRINRVILANGYVMNATVR